MDDDDTAIISCIFTVNTYETFKIPSHFTFLLEIKKYYVLAIIESLLL